MVVIKIYDRRYQRGYRIQYYNDDEITRDIFKFVKNNSRVFSVLLNGDFYLRDDFLEEFNALK